MSVLSKMRAQSPDKFMDVTSDVNIIDEDGHLSCNMTIRTNLNDDSQLHDEHTIAVREEPNHTLTLPARCHERETQWCEWLDTLSRNMVFDSRCVNLLKEFKTAR